MKKAAVLTGDDTPRMQGERRVLGHNIGTIEHPYFTNSVRKYDERFGKKAAAPKLAALIKKESWRADSSLDAYKRRHERRKSFAINPLSAPSGKTVLLSLAKAGTTEKKKNDAKKKKTGEGGSSSDSKNNGDDQNQLQRISAAKAGRAKKKDSRGAAGSLEKKTEPDRVQQDSKARRQILEKRKVAKAWFKMACNGRVRSAIVRDGAVKAITLLATIPDETIRGFCSDCLCELTDLPENRSQMIEDGAAKALMKLCKSPSSATQYSCALAFGSLACETGYETDLIEMGVLSELMDTHTNRNKSEEYTNAVARAVFNFACVEDYMMSVQSTSPRLEDVVKAAFSLSTAEDEAVRVLCYRTLTCLARVGPLRKLMMKLGVVKVMKDFGNSSHKEGPLMCALALCLFSFTRGVRVSMMEQGGGLAALSVVKNAMSKMEELAGKAEKTDSLEKESREEMDILCLTVATLTNLALTPTTRTMIISDGVVPIILGLIEHGDDPVKRACAATLRGLTLDDNATIITEIVHQGGLEAILRLCSVTDILILRNCSSALANTLAHGSLLEVLFSDKRFVDTGITQLTVDTVMQLLKSNDTEIVKHASLCLYNLSCVKEDHTAAALNMLVAAGAVAAAVRVVAELDFMPEDVRSLYSGTFLNLSYCQKHSDRMHTERALDALVVLMDASFDESRIKMVKHNCCSTLFNMVATPEHRNLIIDEPSAVEALLRLSVSNVDEARIMCGAILCRIASDSSCAKRFVDLGLLQALITLVSWRDQTTRQRCIVAAVTLAEGDGMRSRLVEEGAVPALISLLSSHDKVMRRDCAAALCDLTCTEGGAFKATIVEQGAVSALTVVALVRSTEDMETRKVCSKALYNLLDATNTVERMVEEGLVGALTALSGIDEETLEYFAEGVCNVAQYKAGRVEVGKERVLRTLLGLVNSSNPKMHRACAQTLCNLSCFDEGTYCHTVAKAGGMKAIKQLVATFQLSSDTEMEEVCTRTLCSLACNESSREIFLVDGGLHSLMGLGKTDNELIKFQCANVLLSLSLGGNTCTLAVEEGAMALLYTIAHSKEERTQLICARSLLLFAEYEQNRMTIIEQKGVMVASLLGYTELGRKVVIRALTLLSMAKSNVAAAKMVESGAVSVLGTMVGLKIGGGDDEEEGKEKERKMAEIELSLADMDVYTLLDACIAITQLSYRSNTARMVQDNATECVVAFLQKFQNNANVRARVACALRNMSCHTGNLVQMVGAGASKWLIRLSSDANLQTQQHCMVGLCNMADMEDVRPLLVSQGAVAAIMNLSKMLRDEDVARQCAVSLSNLAIAEGTHDGIVKGGAVSALMWLSKEGMELDEDEEPWEDNYIPKSNANNDNRSHSASVGNPDDVGPDNIVTAHVRVDLPNVRGGMLKFEDLSHISVQMEAPILCSMVWHMTSVTTSVKPPPDPTLPIIELVPVEHIDNKTESNESAMGSGGQANTEDEDVGAVPAAGDSLGMSRVIEITRHHIGQYKRISRSREQRDILRKMRELEKPRPTIIASRALPSKPAVDSPPSSTVTGKNEASLSDNSTILQGSQSLPALTNVRGFTPMDTLPRIVTPGPPLQMPASNIIVAPFNDAGSFMNHLDHVLGPLDVHGVGLNASTSAVGLLESNTTLSSSSKLLKGGIGLTSGKERPRPKSKDEGLWPYSSKSGPE